MLHLPDLEAAVLIIKTGARESERYEDQVRQKFLDKVITNVKERFPQIGVLEAFSALDPSGMLGEPEISIGCLSTIIDHYDVEGPMGINRSDCEKEYTEFTSFVKEHAIL